MSLERDPMYLYLSLVCVAVVITLFYLLTRPDSKTNMPLRRFLVKVMLMFFVVGVMSFVTYMLEGRGGPPSVTTGPAIVRCHGANCPTPKAGPPFAITLPAVAICRGSGCPTPSPTPFISEAERDNLQMLPRLH